MLRRVVVTGMGIVSPLGVGVDHVWSRITQGHSGAQKVTDFDVSDIACQVAARIPRGEGEGEYNPDLYLDLKEQRKVDEFISFAIAAADMAIEDSGWKPEKEEDQDRTGVLVGSGIGGLKGIEVGAHVLRDKGPRRMSPFFIPGALINLASGQISIRHQFRGPNHSVVTACSTGAHAIGDASRIIALGDADVMVAGGSESPIGRLALSGFAACRALTTAFNDDPLSASRPYDKDRDGFLMGEGAGVVILEEYEHAKARGAKIYGEIIGYGMSGDAHHITAPASDGNGAYRCMQAALKRAEISADDINYVNAHGTSTPLGDEIELGAVRRLFGEDVSHVKMSSTKSAIGHLLGAAGAVEAIFALKSIDTNIVPPTLNLDNPSVESDIDLVPHSAKDHKVDVALSNSFGFGGTNASLVFRRV